MLLIFQVRHWQVQHPGLNLQSRCALGMTPRFAGDCGLPQEERPHPGLQHRRHPGAHGPQRVWAAVPLPHGGLRAGAGGLQEHQGGPISVSVRRCLGVLFGPCPTAWQARSQSVRLLPLPSLPAHTSWRPPLPLTLAAAPPCRLVRLALAAGGGWRAEPVEQGGAGCGGGRLTAR